MTDRYEEIHRALRDEFHDLRMRAETSWNRGFQEGLASNRLLATQAAEALKKEREAHAETNRAMTEALLASEERAERAEADAARWQYIRRKLCLTGNGDGTCAMQAINLPANIQGWPEPGQVAEFCDAAIDEAIEKENSND